ncbi:MAG: FAD-dependent monooxygenase [Gammaproteobacteria bacterium]|nr:FAD-dependent monooxygenase [Gammaproteobacteria bacterium]
MQAVDVIIVGGGPVGLGLAIELGQRGVACTVVERFMEPQAIPKGQNLTQRTVEHFHCWGVAQGIDQARVIPKSFGIAGLTAYGTLLGDYAYDWLQRDKVRPYYFADNDRLPQNETEKVLRRRVAELAKVNTLFGCTAEMTDQDENGVKVSVSASGAALQRRLQGTYLVGCDGSRSLVREQAGISQNQDDHDRRMVLLVFRSPQLHRLLERYPGKSYYNVLDPRLDGYWKFFGRVDLGERWFFHAPVPPDTTLDNFGFKRLLHEAVGEAFDLEFEHVGFWDLRIASATTYRKERVFIAGDAAHSHPPYGGFGINTGFEDARNLGWKLAAVLQGWGGERLLNAYDAERRPVFESTAEDFIQTMIREDRAFVRNYDPQRDRVAFEAEWQRRISGGNAIVHGFEPNYVGSPIVFGAPGSVCSARGTHEFAARAGHHLAPRDLSSGARLFTELSDGFALIALGEGRNHVEEFQRVAATLSLPLKVIQDDRKGDRRDWQADLILVRPDHFIAFAGDRLPADIETVVKVSAGLG